MDNVANAKELYSISSPNGLETAFSNVFFWGGDGSIYSIYRLETRKKLLKDNELENRKKEENAQNGESFSFKTMPQKSFLTSFCGLYQISVYFSGQTLVRFMQIFKLC